MNDEKQRQDPTDSAGDMPVPSAAMAASEQAVLREHHVWVESDNRFQRRARLLQALWREDQELPIGEHGGRPQGSRLAMPRAEERLEAYLTPTIREVVRREVVAGDKSAGKFYKRPRIFENLLSSQPLCFNLFGELAVDLELASAVFRRLLPARVARVEAIEFEWSPGRADPKYTNDKSAFDVFVRYATASGAPGFVGIEVKYHEGLHDRAANLRPRYLEVADAMGAFQGDRLGDLQAKPLQQVWRDHLLAGSMLTLDDAWSEGLFVFLYPRLNQRCDSVVRAYQTCLTSTDSFATWTLEQVVAAVRAETTAAWPITLHNRYLDFERAEALLEQPGLRA